MEHEELLPEERTDEIAEQNEATPTLETPVVDEAPVVGEAPVVDEAPTVDEAPVEGEAAKKEEPGADLTSVTNDTSCFESVYEDTLYFVDGMVEQYDFYPEIIDALANGSAKLELKKRYMLKAIDEEWVTMIEDCIPALDEVIRAPSRFIEETERVLPIELSRNISSRSIQHLSQHTDYISKVEGDMVTPSKILNVFRDETNKTYENKFINTLINRLFWFVERRYETALKEGKDEKNTSLDYSQNFNHGEMRGKIHFRIEVAEEPKSGEELKNYTYTTDLWQRVIRLHHVCRAYVNSSFVASMENQFVRPPIIRTNAILKNKNLRQCLELWEYIESYENLGYNMLVQENLETIDARYVKEIYSISALQYLIFRHNIKNEFEADKSLSGAESSTVLSPQIQETATPPEVTEFNRTFTKTLRVTEEAPEERKKRKTQREKAALRAVDVALISDALMKKNKPVSEIPKRHVEPRWVGRVKRSARTLQIATKRMGEDVKETTLKVATATVNGVTSGAKFVADGAKKGWDTSAQKVEAICRTYPEELERVADKAAEIALDAALIGVVALCKEKERKK